MPTFMDRHDLPGASAEEVADAHVQDLRWEHDFGVRFLSYWFDPARGAAFCLVEGPDAGAVERCHRRAHGIVPHSIAEVDPRTVVSFLGAITDPEPGTPWSDSAFRTLLLTDIVGSTSMIERIGDVAAKELVLSLDAEIRDHVEQRSGRRVDHTGDGVLASFRSAADAVGCAVALLRAIEAREGDPLPLHIRIGIAAGEPIKEGDRLFGAAVNLAARICAVAEPSTVYVPSAVRELTLGKGFTFLDRGRVGFKGFADPVQVFEVPWADVADPTAGR
jgi:class 3 adenylate cyclase